MGKPIVVENQVLSFAPSSEKPGSWLKLKVIDDKGTARETYLKTDNLKALVTQPGFYKFTKEKNGQYWEVTGVQFVRPLQEGGPLTQASGNGASAPSPRIPGQIDPNVLLQNKCITSQVCVKSAADVISAALAAGAFKSTEENAVIDVAAMSEAASGLAKMFLAEIREFVSPATPATKESEKPGTYKDENGRTHEPVVEGA